MESLDLVITSDTAIAHLAGALGRPVWVALKWVPDWRWLLDRPDSPWYPTMRLFRQPSRGDWKGAVRAMRDELAGRTGAGKPAATTIAEKLKEALALHQQGKFVEAENLYEDILLAQPDQFDALHLLGTLLHQTGKSERGVDLIGKAITINPKVAAAHSNLGIGLKHLGRLDEALNSYDKAIELNPDYAEAFANRGNVLKDLKRFDEALASYNRAIALKPDYAEAYSNRGLALVELKRPQDALASCDRAIELKSDYADAHSYRGIALYELKRTEEALASYDRAIALKPDDATTHSNRGVALKDLNRLGEALASSNRAIALKPDFAEAHFNRGCVLNELQRFDEAILSYDKAIALKPDYTDVHSNRGVALKEMRRVDEALASYDRAIALNPDHFDAHWNRSLALLLVGRLQQAWPEYEWRRQKPDWIAGRLCPTAPYRLWQVGDSIAGKTVLVSAEQGLGDTLQLCRYLKLLEARGARVVLVVQSKLRSILRTLSPTIEVLIWGEAVPATDYHCPLASLPLTFGATLENIPANVPYLKADSQRVERWRHRLGREGLRIGIAWQGQPGPVDVGRSFAVSGFEEISQLSGVRLISLQKNLGSEQLARLPAGMKVETLGEDFDSGPDAFLDTAAVMESLDLVITSDTAIAHLAGALGRPVWVALQWVPDWRWLLDRPDTPWYPTMRLFRQSSRGAWGSVFRAMKQELAAMVRGAGESAVATTGADLKDVLALHRQGKLAEAQKRYEEVLKSEPDHFDALHMLGLLLHQAGQTERGIELIQKAIALNPRAAGAYSNLGTGLRHVGRLEEALAIYDKAVALKPDYADAYYNRGNVLHDLKRLEEARASFEQAVALKPDYAEAYFNRGNVLHDLARLDEALASYDKAIALKPDYSKAHANRASAVYDLNRLDEAIVGYDKAIALSPDFAEAYNNRGSALKELRRIDEALASFDRAIALKPDYIEAHFNRSLTVMLLGRLERGWPEYEWRKRKADWTSGRLCPERGFQPWRTGEDIAGKTVLVSAEQGQGDTFQFCRYLKLLEANGARVIFAVQERLRPILRTLNSTIRIVVPGEDLPATDYHSALMSLPMAFGTTLETIPAEVPYLQTEPGRVERWRQRLGREGLRIGIAWQGRPGLVDTGRSFAVSEFAEIGKLPGVRLISLQKNFGSEQLARLPAGMKVETLGEDFDAGPEAFLDTAAVMESLDLVITSDTAIAHLAGALGRPVWVALKGVPDWRWLLDRADSPWYPTMRLFRQPSRGDWKGVFGAMKQELSRGGGKAVPKFVP
jgi:tetratricopeptide (TPR) repeat protein